MFPPGSRDFEILEVPSIKPMAIDIRSMSIDFTDYPSQPMHTTRRKKGFFSRQYFREESGRLIEEECGYYPEFPTVLARTFEEGLEDAIMKLKKLTGPSLSTELIGIYENNGLFGRIRVLDPKKWYLAASEDLWSRDRSEKGGGSHMVFRNGTRFNVVADSLWCHALWWY